MARCVRSYLQLLEVESRLNVEYVQIDFGQEVLSQVLQYLYEQNLNSLMVEGGAELLESFFDAGLWDEAWVETAPARFGCGCKSACCSWRVDRYGTEARTSFGNLETKGLK